MDYEKILKGIVQIINTAENSDIGFANICDYIGENCPELKESEDELTRKDLLEYVKHCVCYRDVCKEEKDKWIAWLEKQGKKNDINPSLIEKEKKDNAFMKMMFKGKTALEAIKEEKVDNANKIEPKLKVGDWITNSIETVQITGYDIDYGYQVDYKGNLQHRYTDIIEKEYHLWTIQDAKDGDVLATLSGAFIYNGNNGGGSCPGCYCGINTLGRFKVGVEHHWTGEKVYPATKKQRDILFAKMHEAGYEFDVEKKELKEIEQKSAEWNEEDVHRLKDTIYFLDTAKNHYASTVELDACIDWLKSLKPQKQWKPTKEQMDAFLFVVQHYTPNVSDKLAWDSLKILELMYYEIKQ